MSIPKLVISVAIIVIGIVLGVKIVIDMLCMYMPIVREVLSKKFMSKDVKSYIEDIDNRDSDENREIMRSVLNKRLFIFLIYFVVATVVPIFMR